MEDAELMKYAVKAAVAHGMPITSHPWEGIDPFCEGVDYLLDGDFFMPLEDDGDAFKLAVKCDIAFGRYANTWWARWEFDDKVFRENSEKNGINVHLAAVRMAIVRAAAQLGKAMP